MATWVEVKGFIRSSYKLQDDEGDFFKIIFTIDEQRTQVVFIQKTKSNGGDIWIQIMSPVGVIERDDLDDALEFLNEQMCGGLVKIGEKHFVRHSMPIEDLSQEEFDTPLRIVTLTADEIERKFVGGDQN